MDASGPAPSDTTPPTSPSTSCCRAVPAEAAADLAALTICSDTTLVDVRRRTWPEDVVLAPTSIGSTDTGGADADWIAGDLLVDVKATRNPRKLPGPTIYQLAGYVLLDYDDTYRIREIGCYHTRAGILISWPVGTFFALLGAHRPLCDLRRRAHIVLAGRMPAT